MEVCPDGYLVRGQGGGGTAVAAWPNHDPERLTDATIAICTACNREFKVPLEALKRVADAQQNLTLQFERHQCKENETDSSVG